MITANELKTKGVGIIEERLNSGEEEIITIRGKNKYVVVDLKRYEYLRECELLIAAEEVKKDIARGDYIDETAAEHINRLVNDNSDD
jgi:hypothetical protein